MKIITPLLIVALSLIFLCFKPPVDHYIQKKEFCFAAWGGLVKGGNVNWVGFAAMQGVRELKISQQLYFGIAGEQGDNLADFEQAIVKAYKNDANSSSILSSNSLTGNHLEIIKKYK